MIPIELLYIAYQAKLPKYEIRGFLCASLGISLEELMLLEFIDKKAEKKFEEMCARRLSGEPFSYIVGKKEFFGYEFEVTPDVLIPRPETELLVEESLKYLNNNSLSLDLCTGSGCVAISAALESNSRFIGTDISKAALKLAKRNASKLGADKLVSFKYSNWFDSIEGQKFDVIISNPPYIANNDSRISESVRKFEPHIALYSGPIGLEAYCAICSKAPIFLKSRGILIVECGAGQWKEVEQIFCAEYFSLINIAQDLQGISRALSFCVKNK